MAERVINIKASIEGAYTFDEAARKAQEAVDCDGASAAGVIDGRTGEIVANFQPLPEAPASSTVGYSKGFANAWDEMMARRAARESKGQRTTDD